LLRERFACEGRTKVSRERKGRQADSRCQLEAGSPLGPNAYGQEQNHVAIVTALSGFVGRPFGAGSGVRAKLCALLFASGGFRVSLDSGAAQRHPYLGFPAHVDLHRARDHGLPEAQSLQRRIVRSRKINIQSIDVRYAALEHHVKRTIPV